MWLGSGFDNIVLVLVGIAVDNYFEMIFFVLAKIVDLEVMDFPGDPGYILNNLTIYFQARETIGGGEEKDIGGRVCLVGYLKIDRLTITAGLGSEINRPLREIDSKHQTDDKKY